VQNYTSSTQSICVVEEIFKKICTFLPQDLRISKKRSNFAAQSVAKRIATYVNNMQNMDFNNATPARKIDRTRPCHSGYVRVLSKKFNTPHPAMSFVEGQLTQA